MDSTQGLEPGQMIISKAGRDKGRNFIIMKILDDKHVLLADGDLRKVESGKKKKAKHLAKTNKVSLYLSKKLLEGQRVTNAMIRAELEKFSLDD